MNLWQDVISKARAMRRDRRFTIFALLYREGATDWDLVVAAPWLKLGDSDSHAYISTFVRESLPEETLLELGRIIIVDPKDRSLRETITSLRGVAQQDGVIELGPSKFSGIQIERGYVLLPTTGAPVPAHA